MAFANISLGALNGEFQIGLAVGTDHGAAEEDHLPLLAPGYVPGQPVTLPDARAAATNAARWAYNRYHGNEFMVCAAWAAIMGSMVRVRNATIDGDWRFTAQAEGAGAANDANIAEILTEVNLRKAVLVLIATKANFWNMNHHIGQRPNHIDGFAGKVFALRYPGVPLGDAATGVHAAGHWISSAYVLRRAGVPGVIATQCAVQDPEGQPTFTAETLLRFATLPAGTHKVAVCYDALRRMVGSVLAPACPGVTEMSEVVEARNDIIAARVQFHMGAQHLSGQARLTSEPAHEVVGRLGAYVRALFPRSTLAASPHFSEQRVTSADDYDVSWAALCNTYALKSAGRINVRRLEEAFGMVGVGDQAEALLAVVRGVTGNAAATLTAAQLVAVEAIEHQEEEAPAGAMG